MIYPSVQIVRNKQCRSRGGVRDIARCFNTCWQLNFSMISLVISESVPSGDLTSTWPLGPLPWRNSQGTRGDVPQPMRSFTEGGCGAPVPCAEPPDYLADLSVDASIVSLEYRRYATGAREEAMHIKGSENHLICVATNGSLTLRIATSLNIRISYCPFGFSSQPTAAFTGHRREQMTGCYLLGNGHRAFNPVLGRFGTPDKLSPFGAGGLNAYTYCGGDPVNRSDPTGRLWKKLKGAIAGFLSTPSGPPAAAAAFRPLPPLPRGYPFPSGTPPALKSSPEMDRLVALAEHHDALTDRILNAATVAQTLPLLDERRVIKTRILNMLTKSGDVYLPSGPGADHLNPFRYTRPRGSPAPEASVLAQINHPIPNYQATIRLPRTYQQVLTERLASPPRYQDIAGRPPAYSAHNSRVSINNELLRR